ncbi:uncharacterized protein LOC129768197 [Toxorhynchites rutilus septentrionalis]|uniref:uncharacterized protein LOC129768197 n=1 Tax=Toxorhynchites rutilus septentrionalis TaxID=329112 RepID=UPI002479259D|nr:uncharacterized protein LOC129768197 [Toxorhynchites rutilus septentrionalis]
MSSLNHFLCKLLVAVAALSITTQAATMIINRDFVFPTLNEKGLGDRCEIDYGEGAFVKLGTCERVRDCGTFPQRLRSPRFSVFRELCYFEVHDPVVCCLSARDIGVSQLARSRVPSREEMSYEDFETANLV